jgi:glycosyltransferase involved in cell wall biosynthesis/predicted metal-dependent phosphoesterase TrpH
MHCHSTASEVSRLGVQRALGLPECATPPEEVYALAKRRGMDFVTITDHDTIDGVLQIDGHSDVFVSEELTASFRGEPQTVHVLCYGIDGGDHEWLQAHSGDVELCAAYMYERDIACALAHPYYNVAAPLSARHRRRLADLFDVWETRNGARASELNRPAATYVATRDGTGIGGSDDHAGVDIGRTFTEAPPAASPQEFLAHLRAGRVRADGAEGSAAKWAHAAIALAVRSVGLGSAADAAADPARVLMMVHRLLREGDVREGATARTERLTPADGRALLRAWLQSIDLQDLDERELISYMQEDSFSHSDLYRRASRAHERKLATAVAATIAAAAEGAAVEAAAAWLFEACVPAIPYAPAAAFLGNEQAKLAAIPYAGSGSSAQPYWRRRGQEERAPRVAILADGIGSTHGVTRTIQEIRDRGVRGYAIEVLGTDAEVDRRLPAVAEIDVPFYPGLRIGVPSLPIAVQTLAEGRFDAIHVCSPGPAGALGAMLARALRLPLLGSYHTELTAYTHVRTGDERLTATMTGAVSAFYGACDVVLSPSEAADEGLHAIGVRAERVLRWERGVDTARFDPVLRERVAQDGRIDVLYAGRLTSEKGIELLARAFALAYEQDPRLRLVLAGSGPEEQLLRDSLGERARFLGWLDGAELARAYADADIFMFPSETDTFGQVILEAQASGLPVIAVAAGGPRSLVEHRVSGLLCSAETGALATAALELAGNPQLRAELAVAGLASARGRTWERALEHLAEGYMRALGDEVEQVPLAA